MGTKISSDKSCSYHIENVVTSSVCVYLWLVSKLSLNKLGYQKQYFCNNVVCCSDWLAFLRNCLPLFQKYFKSWIFLKWKQPPIPQILVRKLYSLPLWLEKLYCKMCKLQAKEKFPENKSGRLGMPCIFFFSFSCEQFFYPCFITVLLEGI